LEDTGIVPNRHGRRQRRERFGEFGRRVRRRRKTRLVIALYILLFFTLSMVGVARSVSSEASFDEEARYSAAEDNGILSEPEFPALNAVTPVLNTTAFVFQDIPALRFYDSDFVWEGDRLTYTGDEYDVRFGIDISAYQTEDRRDKKIDWEAAKADGVEFAIIRVAIRGTSEGALWIDNFFGQNIDGAMAAGLQTGVYVFSQAVTVEEALDEAELVIACLREHPIDGPVCYDWEVENRTYRTYRVSGDVATACALAFCQRIEEAGYTPMIYTSHEIADLRYDWDTLSAYRLWYPWYMSKGDHVSSGRFYPHMVIWQFSKRCQVDGVGKKVDGNLWFRPKY
jgi:GH25 family lysozyme M1 (1,4-beta-N-acetylmuramidase)